MDDTTIEHRAIYPLAPTATEANCLPPTDRPNLCDQ
jgi:hypothetical protein